MSEMELKTEVEAQEFTDELSDETLDRAEGLFLLVLSGVGYTCYVRPACGAF